MTPASQQVSLARFRTVKAAEAIDVEVHFNPASLAYTLSNALREEGQGARKKQYVSQTSATLTMDLVFDSTDSGSDVREATDAMARLLRPNGPSGRQVPPLVEFSWGAYSFSGLVSQYKETIDYFSADGVPLRSTINLSLVSQDVSFDSGRDPGASVDAGLGVGLGASFGADLVTLPSASASFGGAAGLAMSLGDPRAARAIASVNGSASLRFSGGVEMAVGGAGVELAAAAAFSAGASAGVSLGASAGVSVGGGVGGSAGASAGFAASAGAAFGGLRSGGTAVPALPSATAALALSASAQPGLAAIGVGGRARAGARASLATDVGAGLRFGE